MSGALSHMALNLYKNNVEFESIIKLLYLPSFKYEHWLNLCKKLFEYDEFSSAFHINFWNAPLLFAPLIIAIGSGTQKLFTSVPSRRCATRRVFGRRSLSR